MHSPRWAAPPNPCAPASWPASNATAPASKSNWLPPAMIAQESTGRLCRRAAASHDIVVGPLARPAVAALAGQPR
jgi:hypothetical protein